MQLELAPEEAGLLAVQMADWTKGTFSKNMQNYCWPDVCGV